MLTMFRKRITQDTSKHPLLTNPQQKNKTITFKTSKNTICANHIRKCKNRIDKTTRTQIKKPTEEEVEQPFRFSKCTYNHVKVRHNVGLIRKILKLTIN